MEANKHIIYLTKNHQLPVSNGENSNVFMFNANGPKIQAKWVKKSIESCNGCFVVMDHNNEILRESERMLTKRNYFIENVNFDDMTEGIKINPFDLVKDTSEIHFMFLNFLYAMWDNRDPDISAMSNLIDAFASCVFFMFENNKEKMNMQTLKKMVNSVRAILDTEDGPVLMSDAIFSGIKDQNSMPCKYYAQFKKASGKRFEEVAEKVAQVFDMFTDSDMEMMSVTDEFLSQELNSKTAIFINIKNEDDEHSAKILMTLLNYFVQRSPNHAHTLFVIDRLEAKYNTISLPHWMKDAVENNMTFLVIGNDLSSFMENQRSEKFFRNMQKEAAAYVLLNHNEMAIKYSEDLPTTDDEMDEFMDQDIIAVVQIPEDEISEQDQLF